MSRTRIPAKGKVGLAMAAWVTKQRYLILIELMSLTRQGKGLMEIDRALRGGILVQYTFQLMVESRGGPPPQNTSATSIVT